MSTREEFQGVCFVSDNGKEYMEHPYDDFPRPLRERLANSRHNICAACVWCEINKDLFFVDINRIIFHGLRVVAEFEHRIDRMNEESDRDRRAA